MKQQLEILEQDGGDPDRTSITTRQIIQRHQKLCKHLFSIKDFDFMVDFLENAFQVTYKKSKPEKSIEAKTKVSTRYGNIVVDETLCSQDVIGILFGIKKQKSLQIVSIDG